MDDPSIEITCAEVKAALDSGASIALLDCREPDEYATAAIAGAILVPLGEFPDRAAGELGPPSDDPSADRRIIVHCHLGGRSLRAAQYLREQGYSNAQSMAGGIDQWAIEIDPTVPRY